MSHSEVLHHSRVPYLTEEFTLPFEPLHNQLAARVIELEEDGVQQFSSTWELVQFSLADATIGPCAQRFVLE